MAGFRIGLPLFLLGLIEVKAANIKGLTYYDALTMAVTYFNKETDEKNSFWFTAAEPPPDWNTSREPYHVSFTAKETDCLTAENITPVTCAFKKNGSDTTGLDEFRGPFQH
uniref:Cathelicidin-7-like n=1 Tax=Phascolarctos cinereus TaxID=38626 RepID=A0A6P5LA47_PHACI|nr:cathelicidin-7-like [Phascolarctos cinereus]